MTSRTALVEEVRGAGLAAGRDRGLREQLDGEIVQPEEAALMLALPNTGRATGRALPRVA